ncbi:hypothetical protein V6Z96_003121 [Aspergillus fumigatus]|uniref:Uncharacterized protein n=1 Tax=Aspergillus fumigatus TaxID=746128 RepID=Q6MY73_ASPFM|nr:hypothetical protein AfA33H4.105 [Aspergillus fumigatus]
MLLQNLHHIPFIRPRRTRHRLLHYDIIIIRMPSAPPLLLHHLNPSSPAASAVRPPHPSPQRALRRRRHRHGADFYVVGAWFVVEPEAEVGEVEEEDEACDAA